MSGLGGALKKVIPKGAKKASELLDYIGMSRPETDLKVAEAKVAGRSKGEKSLENDPAMEAELLDEVGADLEAGNMVVPEEPAPDLEPVSMDQVLKQGEQKPIKPLSDEELNGLLDAGLKPMAHDTEYTNLNLARVNTPEEIGGLAEGLMRVASERDMGLPERSTHKKWMAEANQVEWSTITAKKANGEMLSQPELVYARQVEASLVWSLQKQSDEMLEKINSQTVTERDYIAYNRASIKTMAVVSHMRGEVRRIAQLLNSMAITVDGSTLNSAQRDDFLEAGRLGGAKMNRQIEMIASSRNTKEALDIVEKATGFQRSLNVATNHWFNNVLSQYALPKAFTAGLVVGKGLLPMERLVGSLVMKARPSLAKGQPAYNSTIHSAEAVIELLGFARSLKDMVSPLVKHLQDPEYSLGRTKVAPIKGGDASMLKDNIHNAVLKLNPDAGAVARYSAQLVDAGLLNFSMRAMSMVDFFVRSTVGMSRAKALAFRVAKNEGLTEHKEIMARVDELLEDMPDEMYDDMLEAGNLATLTSKLSEPSMAFQQFIQRSKLSLPVAFTRTMLVAFEATLDRVPMLGLAMPRVRKAMEAGGAKKADAIAKQITGLSVISMGYMAYLDGEATSGLTYTENEKAKRRRLKVPELSMITDGGSTYNMNFMSPLHDLYMIGVTTAEYVDRANESVPPDDPRYKSWEQIAFEASMTAMYTVVDIGLNKSVGRSLKDLLDAITDPAKHGERKTMGTLQPFFQVAGQKHMKRAIDPIRRRVPESTIMTEFVDSLKAVTPWMSEDLPPRRGVFGEPAPEYTFVGGLINYTGRSKYADVANELLANDVDLRLPSNTVRINGVDVNLDVDLSPSNLPEGILEEFPKLKQRGYLYDMYSSIQGNLYASSKMFEHSGEVNEVIGLKGFINSRTYKNKSVPYGEARAESGEITKGTLLEEHKALLNRMAKLMLLDELSNMMPIYDIVYELGISRGQEGLKRNVDAVVRKGSDIIKAEDKVEGVKF